jgi:glycosyltransferase involved in cell wall biosynthesis
MPVVSVHMITYNHEPYLAQAIESVINQKTAYPFELIIGEDCSTDGTREIALNYQRRCPGKIRVLVSDQNVGWRENTERVKAAHRGEYVAYCEGDDYWSSPDKLQKQIDRMERNPSCTLSFHNATIQYEDPGRKPRKFNSRRINNVTVEDIIEGDWIVPTASVVVRRSCPLASRISFESFPCGDLPTSIIFGAAGSIQYLDECLSVYRVHQDGISQFKVPNPGKEIEFWRRIIRMFEILDGALECKYHDSFKRRIRWEQDKIDYLHLRHGLKFSPRIILAALRFKAEEQLNRETGRF